MHIPDNYLSPSTCAVMTAAVIPAWVHSVKKVSADIPREKMVLLGVGAAFSFLGMMFNIPMIGGTTGHAVGGTLIALLLGPEAACIAVTIALLVQALLFGDGGILAFGANCFNMAFVLPFVGYYSYKLIRQILGVNRLNYSENLTMPYNKGFSASAKGRELVAAGFGSYLGINAAALMAALEFGIQPLLFVSESGVPLYCPYGLSVAVPAMMIGHLTVFGAAEVIFTVAIYAFLTQGAGAPASSGEALSSTGSAEAGTGFGSRRALILMLVMIVLTPLGLLAAGTAWGEWDISEMPTMTESFSWNSLAPDYSIGELPEVISYILSAIVGVAILIIVFRLISGSGKKETDFD